MRHDPASDDAVVEVNFGAATVREVPDRGRATVAPATLLDLVRTIMDRRWTVAGVALAAVALAVLYLATAAPVYESKTVLQIEDKSQTLRGLEGLNDFIGDAATPAETEIEIIRSRTLIGATVQQLGLDVDVAPRRAPLVGDALARRWGGDGPAPARFGLVRYGWGGERIRVERLTVPETLRDAPLVLTALEGGRFRVATGDGAPLFEGAVGAPAGGGPAGERVELTVEELVARPGTEFLVSQRARGDAIDSVLERLRVEETAKKTGVLVVRYEDPDPQQVASTVNAIAELYLRRNVERKSSETQQMLGFLESQLPQLHANVEKAEAALNAFQQAKRSMDISQETEALLGRAVRVETALQELQMQLADLRQRFTENHPSVVALQQKISRMQGERASVDAEMRTLPERELDSARLARDVKVASELYVVVLNKAEELKVARSGVVGNVAILDAAEPARHPARPRAPTVLSLAILLGLGFGVAVALVRNAFDEGCEDPDEIEARTGLPVFVTVPHSEVETRLDREARRVPGAFRTALAEAAADDLAIEGLRSLRTALQFALVEARNNVVALGAPAPAEGKSFVSVNLAHLLAAAGRRVLLVDGDLRRGRLHRYFSLERSPGLSDVVCGAVSLEDALRHTAVERLDVLSTGRIPPNPAELLASHRFQQLLAAVSQRYDLVIVDTPPVLAVTDPALIARHAGVNLLVLRAGAHSAHEIVLATKQLAQAGVRTQGAILNEVRAGSGRYGRYGRGGRYQRYEYRSDMSESSPARGFFRRKRR